LLAKELIKENNPLEGYPLTSVFTIFKPCAPCCDKKPKEEEEKKSSEVPLLTKLAKSQSKKASRTKSDLLDEETKTDPYVILGSGMIAYRDLLFTMIIVFCILSAIMAPVAYFYSQYDAIKIPKMMMTNSLGNMGYSSAQCSLLPLGAGPEAASINVPIECPFGNFGEAHSFGINPGNLVPNNYCAVSEKGEINNGFCSSLVNHTYVNE